MIESFRAHAAEDAALARRLNWLMFGRLVIALMGIGAILAIEMRLEKAAFALRHPYYVLIFACAINLAYLLLARARPSLPRPLTLGHLALVQIAVDVLIESSLVYLTGIEQPFTYLYFATVIAAGILVSRRAALLFASISTILLAGVVILYSLHSVGKVDLPFVDADFVRSFIVPEKLKFTLPYVLAVGVSLHLAAFLVGWLAQEIRGLRILHEEILENMPGGLIAIDRDGLIAFANDRAIDLVNLGQSKVRGARYDAVLPRPLAAVIQESFVERADVARELMLGGRPCEITVTRLAAQGRKDERGVIAVIADASMRMELESMGRTTERFRALLEMSASMAHEIRNPLASIRGAAQELGGVPSQSEDDRKLLDVMVKESDRLDRIISDFLDYASDRPLQFELVDASDIVREVGVLLSARRGERRDMISIRVEAPVGLIVRADVDRLKQVVLNLGLNALESLDGSGSIELRALRSVPRVATESRPPREGILIEVHDTGAGIPPADLPRVFDPFFSTKGRGTGMGLAIAQKITRAHGGEIRLESREGQGTVARVWLPA